VPLASAVAEVVIPAGDSPWRQAPFPEPAAAAASGRAVKGNGWATTRYDLIIRMLRGVFEKRLADALCPRPPVVGWNKTLPANPMASALSMTRVCACALGAALPVERCATAGCPRRWEFGLGRAWRDYGLDRAIPGRRGITISPNLLVLSWHHLEEQALPEIYWRRNLAEFSRREGLYVRFCPGLTRQKKPIRADSNC